MEAVRACRSGIHHFAAEERPLPLAQTELPRLVTRQKLVTRVRNGERVVTKSVTLGELSPSPRTNAAQELPANAEREIARRFAFSAFPATTSDHLAAAPKLSVSREASLGPGGTLAVPLGPRNSPAKTLRVSGYHPPKSYQPVSSRTPMRHLERRPQRPMGSACRSLPARQPTGRAA